MTSCPDLRQGPTCSAVWLQTVSLNKWHPVVLTRETQKPSYCPRMSTDSRPHWIRRVSRSQPPTPTSIRNRIASQLRNVRIWRSAGGSSNHTQHSSASKNSTISTPQDGKERRRRARESPERHSSEQRDSVTLTPYAEEGTSPLVMAGVALATTELDRLTTLARQSEELKRMPE